MNRLNLKETKKQYKVTPLHVQQAKPYIYFN